MGNMESWAAYVRRVMGTDSQGVAAGKVGVTQPTISSWRTPGRTKSVPYASAGAFARAYGRNPVEAFVASGNLELEEGAGALDEDSIRLLSEIGLVPPDYDPPQKDHLPRSG